jgi:hypothetical protein
MIRKPLIAALSLSLAACAASPAMQAAPEPGSIDPSVYVLGERMPSEAPALARAAAAGGDTRLIGFIGFALVFPGADRTAADRLGYRLIDAGGDNFRSNAEVLRANRAYAFAEEWNQTILDLD